MNLNLNEQNQTNKLSNVWAYNTSNEYIVIVSDVCIKIYKMFYQTLLSVCMCVCVFTHVEFTKIDSFTSDVCIDSLGIYTLTRGLLVAVCGGISFIHLLLC